MSAVVLLAVPPVEKRSGLYSTPSQVTLWRLPALTATTRVDSVRVSFPLPFPLPLQAAIKRADARVSLDRKSTRLNSSHVAISYAVFCLKKKNNSTLVRASDSTA